MPLCFFDTNVLVYAHDARDAGKQARAKALVDVHTQASSIRVSTQVLVELYNVMTLKLHVTSARAATVVSACMAWPVVETDVALVGAAVALATEHRIHVFDAMVIEAARRCGATTLYSEDMQHGRYFGSLQLVNPFAS